MEKSTPVRQQYLEIKNRYQDMIVLFQMGDFFEAFDEDAETVSRELGIAFTSKQMGKGVRVPLAGVPVHALDQYVGKLIGKGYKVAICEQLTPPGKKLIKRDVTRVVTPGTVVEPNLLEGKTNNYLASVVFEGDRAGIAYVDITTSEFSTTQLAVAEAFTELERLNPSEILVAKNSSLFDLELSVSKFIGITRLDDKWFELETCYRTLTDHFKTESLSPYGCEGLSLAIRAAGSIIYYLSQMQKRALEQLTRLNTYSTESFMELDSQTVRNLEVFQSGLGSASGSLLSVIDFTRTPMGGRLLKKWLRQPLLDIGEIIKRQDAVEWFYNNTFARNKVESML
ncbi:MAG TPA: DNA mismatch repair protein MutS, partial [Thermodesulfobacteriota bacterium]|nr:DNA mismatch repair protein MutS [Thermodesulfobacteriota bacterium]